MSVVLDDSCGSTELRTVAGDQDTKYYPWRDWRPKKHLVRATTVDEVLRAAGVQHIDFMSIDVEGHEGELLKGIDFGRVFIRLLLVETYSYEGINHQLSEHFRILERLSQHDYLFKNIKLD